MFIGHIAGIAFLPVSILLYLNVFGITNMQKIFGIEIMLVASIGIIAVEIGDIINSHFHGEYIILSYIVCIILCFPAVLFFLSKIVTFPDQVLISLPIITASFLFVEGLTSFFIGN